MFHDQSIVENLLFEDKNLILKIEPCKKIDPFKWVLENKLRIEENLIKYGGMLLRNFGLYAVSDFNKLVRILSPEQYEYVYRSTPRKKLGGKVYTATEYPRERIIQLHNENSYTTYQWPKKIYFFSIIVADSGGQTPLADGRRVYNKIDKYLKNKFESKGILYVRNYFEGIDLPWEEVFQTDSKKLVEEFCIKNNISFLWGKSQPILTTQQKCDAVKIHPVTNEQVWFNQAHLFHHSALNKEDLEAILATVGKDNLPRNSFFGDGSEIEHDAIRHIQEIYHEEKLLFNWKKGDVLILDNLLIAHGRETFTGNRKVAVMMA